MRFVACRAFPQPCGILRSNDFVWRRGFLFVIGDQLDLPLREIGTSSHHPICPSTLQSSNSLFAIYSFADVGETIIQQTDFTTAAEILTLISGLTEQNTEQENGFEAIVRASAELSWDDYGNSDRHIVLITDEDSNLSVNQIDAINAANAINAKVSYGTLISIGPTGYDEVKDATGGSSFTSMSGMSAAMIPIISSPLSLSSQKVFVDNSLQLTGDGSIIALRASRSRYEYR